MCNTENSCCESKGYDTCGLNINVTKIVKYVCMAGVLITGIIFGAKCCNKICETFRKK